ncbi:ketopantoate reductase family protein [Planococcus sp. 107-1]|uniref:ketopantoate reductase family protein n=1 Tax=Planococcus sp. 107-1 TaxID=2908840 RepID=UPI001F37835F|nr:2-dehydropantoate 2-reductase [Planococcus sp. 107-1]UJF25830.1 2-dehydropantoate 2-reductase [Planococcus sp. 107-1]
MKFAVVGAGAIGMLIACLLKDAGEDVQLMPKTEKQAKEIEEIGILKDHKLYQIPAITKFQLISPDTYIIVAVKYDALQGLLPELSRECPDNPLIFLQNGMLHLELIEELPQQQIALGSVEHGALKVSATEIRHTGLGTIKFALARGEASIFKPLADIQGFTSGWVEDADQLLFRKVLLNCLINPLTALMEIQNGELLTNYHAYELLRNLYTELYLAFPEIEKLLPFEEVTALCASTSTNTSSMLADKLAKRKMELDTILLYTLRRSKVDLPLLKTLYNLLKATEV